MKPRSLAVLIALLAVAGSGCRSPFADWNESGPPEDPQKVGVGVHGWPFYERAPGKEGVRTDVLWPAASVRTSEDGTLRRADLLVPIVLYEKDGTRSRFGVRPLFDVESDTKEGGEISDVDVLFPIVKWRDAPGESKFEIRPIWWSGHEGEDHRWTTLFPLGGSWDRKDGGGWFAGPLAGTDRKGEHETSWYAAGLVIRETDASKELDGTRLLLGALDRTTWKDGSRWRVFPLASHEEDESETSSETHWIWPGLAGSHTRGDDRTDWVAPLWLHDRDGDAETTVVLPFWYSRTKGDDVTKVVFPVYGRTSGGDVDRTFWGGIVLITTESKDGSATDVLWPLFHHATDADGWDAHVFPVVWLDRHGATGKTHLWPLFGSSWKPGSQEWSVAWPFFTYEKFDDGWKASLPAPLFEIDRSGPRHETKVLVLFDHESNAADGSYEGNLAWLVSNWEADGKGSSDFRILWRLVQDTETPDRHVFAVNPFFRHETNPRGDDHWSALFGLVGRTREADAVRWRLLWFLEI